VWRVCLEKGALALGRMYEILSAEERCRARSFYFDEDRARYVMARGYLRVILSRYLDAEPISLRFRQNPYGKPILVGFENEERLNFGVSHSGPWNREPRRSSSAGPERRRMSRVAVRVLLFHWSNSQFPSIQLDQQGSSRTARIPLMSLFGLLLR